MKTKGVYVKKNLDKMMQTLIDPDFREHAREIAKSQGLNLSEFVRLAMFERIKKSENSKESDESI